MKFFDVNAFIGGVKTGIWRPAMNAKKFIEEMDFQSIDNALVWHMIQFEWSPVDGNEILAKEIAKEKRLFGCWTILPKQTKELGNQDEFFTRMKKNKIYALRAFPAQHHYVFNRVSFGDFIDAVVQKKILFMVSLGRPGFGWEDIYKLLSDFPKLTCVICDTGVWGTDLYFRPLIEKYENVYIDTSMLAMNDGIVEKFVQDYGSDRLLFGTGFPDRYPEAPMLQLKYADIPEKDKTKIASENLERLLTEVRL